jgi:O-antigen ligase
MIFFYILVFTLTMPNHPILARRIGAFTLLKCYGILCLIVAILEMRRIKSCPPFSRAVPSRWYLLFFFVAFVSLLIHDGMAAFQSDPFMYTLSTFSLFIVTTTMVRSIERLRWAVLVVLGSVAWGSLYVIRQWQEFHNIFPGFRTWGGLAGDPNYYAVTVVLWFPLMIFWLMSKRPRWEKWFCVACLAVILIGFMLAASRGGFVGLSVALLFLIWHTRKRLRNFALVSLLLIPIFLAPGQSAITRLLHPDASDQESSEFRLELWEAAENSFLNHPFVGVGLGHYRPLIIRNGGIIYLPFHVAHNTYMGLLADLGLTGIIPFVGILLGSFFNLRRVVRRTKTKNQIFLHQIALGLQAGLLGYMVCAFFLSTLWQQIMWFAVFLSMCLPHIESLIEAKQETKLAPETFVKKSKRLRALTAVGPKSPGGRGSLVLGPSRGGTYRR